MRRRRLGTTGIEVSELALGAMTFGRGFHGIARVGQEEATEMVAHALDRGVNTFAVAPAYSEGMAEELLGRALGRRRREAVLVGAATAVDEKGRSTRKTLLEGLDASFARLGTDYLDVLTYFTSTVDDDFDQVREWLGELVRAGRVRSASFTNLPGWCVGRILGRSAEQSEGRFESGQVLYSLNRREVEADLAPLALREQVGLLIAAPLDGGLLTGRHDAEPGGGKGRRERPGFPPTDREKAARIVEMLAGIANELDATPAQVALAWTAARPFVSTVLVGASSRDQLDANLAAADIRLTPAQTKRLDEVSKPPLLYPNYWYSEQLLDPGAARASAGH